MDRSLQEAVLLAAMLLVPRGVYGSGETVPLGPFDLPPGATVTITFEVSIDAPLPPGVTAVANQGMFTGSNFAPVVTDDPDDATSSADPTVTLIDSADLAITKDDGQTTAVPGEAISYTITVTNAGPNDAVGATVADSFPAVLGGVSWTCVASPGSSCTTGPVAGDLADVVTVLAGGTLTYTVTATIDPAASGNLANTATVSAAPATQDPDPTNNAATDSDTLTPEADLAITKDDGVASVTAGSSTSYTITVTNGGPSDAVGATVTDGFPAVLGGVSWTCVASPGSSCTTGPAAGDLADVVTVLAGGTLTYTATGTIDPGATGTLVNTATVSAPAGVVDPNVGNDAATDSDSIVQSADLALTKSDDADPPPAGSNLTYTLMVENLGPSDATGVVVTDTLPAGLTLVATTGCTEDPNGVPTCTLGAIAAGGSASYTIEASIDSPPPASITNSASVAGDQPDPNSGNDSDSEQTTFDVASPEIAGLDTVKGSGDGELTECETVRTGVRRFEVRFSEAVLDAGAGDPASATDPANYRLVAPAPGSGFDTTSCLSGSGADTVLAIDGVSYDGGTSTAIVEVNGGAHLPDGLYRLLACGTIEDLAGNALDGGAGPGSDLVRTFRVDRRNLLADAHFDRFAAECSIGAWSAATPAEIASPDAPGSPLSGSAHNVDPFAGLDLTQCVPLRGGRAHDAAAAVRVDAAAGLFSFALRCTFFTGSACGGAPGGSAELATVLGDTGGGFLALADVFTPAAGVLSGRCGVEGKSPLGGAVDFYADDVFLGVVELIFSDGFESGDTSAWTASVP